LFTYKHRRTSLVGGTRGDYILNNQYGFIPGNAQVARLRVKYKAFAMPGYIESDWISCRAVCLQ
jgi:hypothetical protein